MNQVTLLPTQCWRFSPLASTTTPVPSFPLTKGKELTSCPSNASLSDGFMVVASTFTKSYPSLGVGLGILSKTAFPPFSCKTIAEIVSVITLNIIVLRYEACFSRNINQFLIFIRKYNFYFLEQGVTSSNYNLLTSTSF